MDEPFSAIDINIKKNLEVRLKTLFKNRKITVVMVTHSMEEALVWGDQIAVFQKNGVTFDKVIDNPYKGLIEKKEEFLKMIS